MFKLIGFAVVVAVIVIGFPSLKLWYSGDATPQQTVNDVRNSVGQKLKTEDSLPSLLATLRTLSFHEKLNIRDINIDLSWSPEQESFRKALAPNLLRQCADLMES